MADFQLELTNDVKFRVSKACKLEDEDVIHCLWYTVVSPSSSPSQMEDDTVDIP